MIEILTLPLGGIMETTVTRSEEDSAMTAVLHVAFELAERSWRLGFTTGLGQKARQRSVEAGDLAGVEREIERARRRFGLAEQTRVVSCYEAGMEGFWLHRALEERGIENVVVDSASIDVKRGRRTAKTDRLDVGALVRKLVQCVSGDRKVWSVVRVPPAEAEDLRHNDRELIRLGDEKNAVLNGIRGLLKTQGIRLGRVRELAKQVSSARTWNGQEIGSELKARLLRMGERLQLIEKQMQEVKGRREELREEDTPVAEKARQLQEVCSL
ncbi:MAG: hypothetical protein GEU90_09690 [Gemmatimonas sp.]|nr:hypothetical protein [Gemmatimonas sp.]